MDIERARGVGRNFADRLFVREREPARIFADGFFVRGFLQTDFRVCAERYPPLGIFAIQFYGNRHKKLNILTIPKSLDKLNFKSQGLFFELFVNLSNLGNGYLPVFW